MKRLGFVAVILASASASAYPTFPTEEEIADARARPRELRGQIQLDLGLSVINAAFEEPIAAHWSLQVEGGIFGTYFLPWFDLGDEVRGWGGGVRPTWFARTSGRGPYVAPYLRVFRISGDDPAGTPRTGVGVTSGVFVGWAFGLTDRIDLRVGLGGQYIYLHAPPLGASTPFIALDLVVGYRL